jgi:hypothetical protein
MLDCRYLSDEGILEVDTSTVHLFFHYSQIEGSTSPSPFGEGRGEASYLFLSNVQAVGVAT